MDRLKWARPDAGTDVLAGDVGPVPHPSDPKRREGQPRVFLGPIASANTLLKDSAKRDALRNQFSAKAVEMEGSGITDATWTHGIGYLVVRGICDYCDAHKNDTWQNYAAMAAAAYVRALLESMPGTVPVPPSLTPGATISAPSGGVLTDDATIIVNQAFKALSDLIQSAEIAVEVRVYQEDFKRTYEKIEILSTYKQLHDLLHDLQLRSYNFIAEQVRIAITGEGYLDWGSLENPAEIDLADLITQLQKVVDRRVLQPFETSWIHGLVKGYEELHEAIARADAERLISTGLRLARIVRIEPSRLAREADSAAKYLQLPKLVQALSNIHECLIRRGADLSKICDIKRGTEVLSALDRDLNSLIIAHNRWQSVDEELRRIDETWDYASMTFPREWPSLRAEVEELLDDAADLQAGAFRKSCERLTAAISSGNPANVANHFSAYRRQAFLRFLSIDKALNDLCGRLRIFDDPLGSILRMF